jgi:hypothetical protein
MAATSTIPHTGWRHLTSADTSIASNNNNFSAMNALDIILQNQTSGKYTPITPELPDRRAAQMKNSLRCIVA